MWPIVLSILEILNRPHPTKRTYWVYSDLKLSIAKSQIMCTMQQPARPSRSDMAAHMNNNTFRWSRNRLKNTAKSYFCKKPILKSVIRWSSWSVDFLFVKNRIFQLNSIWEERNPIPFKSSWQHGGVNVDPPPINFRSNKPKWLNKRFVNKRFVRTNRWTIPDRSTKVLMIVKESFERFNKRFVESFKFVRTNGLFEPFLFEQTKTVRTNLNKRFVQPFCWTQKTVEQKIVERNCWTNGSLNKSFNKRFVQELDQWTNRWTNRSTNEQIVQQKVQQTDCSTKSLTNGSLTNGLLPQSNKRFVEQTVC